MLFYVEDEEMKRQYFTRFFAVSIVMVFMLSLMTACAGMTKVETGDMTGELRLVREDMMIVTVGDEPREVLTNEDTKYYLGDDDHLSVEDIINIKYHTQGGKTYADRVAIVKYANRELRFSGEVTDMEPAGITVTGETMTAFFITNDGTEISGDLSKGDKVDIVYTGNINEYPYAAKINVTEEKKEEVKTAVISGTISDFSEDSIHVSIDSATSYRIALTKDTKFTGVSKYMNTGDSVKITYTGNLKEKAVAVEVNILKKAEELRKVNGTIKQIAEKYVVLNSGKNAYMINIDKDTKYTGAKMTEGCESEITYTGKLGNKPLAKAIYCAEKKVFYKVTFNDGQGHVIKEQQVEKGKAAEAPANPTRNGYTFKGWDKDFKKVTSDLKVTALWTKKAEPKPEPKPDPKPVTKTYKVTFTDGQGTTLSEQKVESGKAAVAPAEPSREGYNFAGWDKDFSKITADLTVNATWKEIPPAPKVFRVTFTDGQGGILSEQDIEEGKAAEAPADPTREGYTFKGWDADFSKITADLIVNATWEEIPPAPNTFKVTFTDGQGGVLSEQNVEEGKAAEAPADPTREGYTFKGWDADFSNITADLTVNATWEENPAPEPEPEPEPVPEPDDPAPAPAPEPKPEPEPTPPAEVIVSAQGVIVENNAEKKILKIEVKGETIELKENDKMKIAAGYTPKKGDKIEVIYTKDDSVLKEIKLIEKAPEQAAAEPAEE